MDISGEGRGSSVNARMTDVSVASGTHNVQRVPVAGAGTYEADMEGHVTDGSIVCWPPGHE